VIAVDNLRDIIDILNGDKEMIIQDTIDFPQVIKNNQDNSPV